MRDAGENPKENVDFREMLRLSNAAAATFENTDISHI